MKSHGPVYCRFDHALLAGCSDERQRLVGQRAVPAKRFKARVDHLLLSKRGQLVGSQRVPVVLDELVVMAISCDCLVDVGDGGGVGYRLGEGRVSRAMAREDLSKGELAPFGD